MIFRLEGLILRQILQCCMVVKAKGKWRGDCPPGVRRNEGKFDFGALVVSSDLRARLPPLLYKCGGWVWCAVSEWVINDILD